MSLAADGAGGQHLRLDALPAEMLRPILPAHADTNVRVTVRGRAAVCRANTAGGCSFSVSDPPVVESCSFTIGGAAVQLTPSPGDATTKVVLPTGSVVECRGERLDESVWTQPHARYDFRTARIR